LDKSNQRKCWKRYKYIIITNLFTHLVIAVAANKSDMYEYEEVEEKDGKKFAKVINAFNLGYKCNFQIYKCEKIKWYRCKIIIFNDL